MIWNMISGIAYPKTMLTFAQPLIIEGGHNRFYVRQAPVHHQSPYWPPAAHLTADLHLIKIN